METSENKSAPEGSEAGADGKEATVSNTESMEERRRKWYEENKDAIDSYNKWVEEHGMLLEDIACFRVSK
ncbi:MAG TPA: type II toxin-antitoxin system CcdA family antitoxin [Steroidobacteraceae bacterium]|nr:type II toxin-antitoxin system CcdA family antitoxin [Steroidobacteraceae bacterium]